MKHPIVYPLFLCFLFLITIAVDRAEGAHRGSEYVNGNPQYHITGRVINTNGGGIGGVNIVYNAAGYYGGVSAPVTYYGPRIPVTPDTGAFEIDSACVDNASPKSNVVPCAPGTYFVVDITVENCSYRPPTYVVQISDANPTASKDFVIPCDLIPPGTPTPTPTPSATPPACGKSCSRDSECAGARDGCSACVAGACKAPPACGTSCSRDSECAGAKNGCSVCVAGTCKSPPACGTSCSRNSECAGAKNGCSVCNSGICSQDFLETMCKCDGIESTELLPGKEVTFTAYGKVEGTDSTKAGIKSMSLFMSEGDSTTGTIIRRSGPLAVAEASRDSAKVRYKAVWKVALPTTLKKGGTYRVWAQIQCEPKAGLAMNQSNNVLAAQTSTRGFFGTIADFLRGLFGSSKRVSTPAPEPTAVSSGGKIKLNTFALPGKVIENSCRSLKFKMPE